MRYLVQIVLLSGCFFSGYAQENQASIERKLTRGAVKQWKFFATRKVRGDAPAADPCAAKQSVIFHQADKTVIRRLCVDGHLETKRNKWIIQIQDAYPVLKLDDNTIYHIRFIQKDGKETLRLTRPGQTEPEYSTNLYFQ